MNRITTSLVIGLMLAAPSLSAAATFTHSLSFGSRGTEVTSLQQILIQLGFLKVSATGYFGALTKRAVIAFQKANGLPQVGIVGPKTRALLNAPPASAAATVTDSPIATSSATTTSQIVISPATSSVASVATTSTSSVATTTSSADTNSFIVTVLAPPSVLAGNTLDTTLIISTNRNATCRWYTLQNALFESMTSFVNTGGTSHSSPFTNLSNGSLYVYYVKCQDAALTISADTMVSFSVASH